MWSSSGNEILREIKMRQNYLIKFDRDLEPPLDFSSLLRPFVDYVRFRQALLPIYVHLQHKSRHKSNLSIDSVH